MHYIVYHYKDLRTQVLTGTDHVGPFADELSASHHISRYGPRDGYIQQLDNVPSPLMSPEDHIAYTMRND